MSDHTTQPHHAEIPALAGLSALPVADSIAAVTAAVGTHPQADEVASGVLVALAKARGLDQFGMYAQSEHVEGVDGQPGVYVYPYARPTAGASVVPVFSDEAGDIYVGLVRNWTDPHDHRKGAQNEWRFSGGYLTPFAPDGPNQHTFDQNFAEAAAREMEEELGIVAASDRLIPLSVTSEASNEPQATHHNIGAFYLYDLGRVQTAAGQTPPPLQAKDDVAQARWVNVKDIINLKEIGLDNSPQARYGIREPNGSLHPLMKNIEAPLVSAVSRVQEVLFPMSDRVPYRAGFSRETHHQHQQLAAAHGFSPRAALAPSYVQRVSASPEPQTARGFNAL